MKIIVFEDDVYVNLFPLTYTRASFELRIGIKTILENIIEKLRPEKIIALARKHLKRVLEERYPEVKMEDGTLDDVLVVNGLLYIGRKESEMIKNLLSEGRDKALVTGKRLVAAKLSGENLRERSLEIIYDVESLRKYLEIEYTEDLRLISYPWDIINYFPEILKEELSDYKEFSSNISNGVYVRGDKKHIYIDDKSTIEPGTVIDVRNGPVYIGKNVEIESPTRIIGPCYIGDNSIIFGARVESSIIGEECRIGGEVVHSIIHRYSNKRHFGFLGHSYVGEWVNLGAGFTNSNLKNTYGEVRMNIRGQNIGTGNTFLGCFIGDHVRASIGTLVYTAKKIGVASHIHGVISEDVPSFIFYAKSLGVELIELDIESVLKSVKRMMSRRGVSLKPAEEELLRKVYEETSGERSLIGARKGEITIK
jgi:UDP-N-acetylglucosamine diphosphorylase / glucose-1-phosphate thymidylyltransferase / UDP-N-acetylgalactosamine diphosphorylase / glucosamine-1-phosphate N-acetyltransferase / galactosamine-1-phosphate N-acetyltransferase